MKKDNLIIKLINFLAMKNSIKTIGFVIALFFFFINIQAQERQFYQIKIYSMDNDQQVQTTDQYLSTAYLPALKRMKIGPIGVFKPRPTDTTNLKQIYVLIVPALLLKRMNRKKTPK